MLPQANPVVPPKKKARLLPILGGVAAGGLGLLGGAAADHFFNDGKILNTITGNRYDSWKDKLSMALWNKGQVDYKQQMAIQGDPILKEHLAQTRSMAKPTSLTAGLEKTPAHLIAGGAAGTAGLTELAGSKVKALSGALPAAKAVGRAAGPAFGLLDGMRLGANEDVVDNPMWKAVGIPTEAVGGVAGTALGVANPLAPIGISVGNRLLEARQRFNETLSSHDEAYGNLGDLTLDYMRMAKSPNLVERLTAKSHLKQLLESEFVKKTLAEQNVNKVPWHNPERMLNAVDSLPFADLSGLGLAKKLVSADSQFSGEIPKERYPALFQILQRAQKLVQ